MGIFREMMMTKRLGYLALVLVLSGCARRQEEPPPSPPVAVAKGGQPFSMQMEKPEVAVVQGTKTKVKVNVTRRGYLGPINVELRGLPNQVTASATQIAPDQNSAEFEVTAAVDAVPGKGNEAHVVGIATVEGQKVISPNFTVTVLEPPFTLRVEPAKVQLQQGTRTTLKVLVQRKNYQEPITLELRNLPKEVQATKVTIPKGQSAAEVEIVATAKAAEGERPNIQVMGMSNGKPSYQAVSPAFSLLIQGLPFALQTDPEIMVPFAAGKVKMKVTAQRHDYQGPIALELRGLPGKLTAAPAQIPDGKTTAEIEITAPDNISPGKSKVQVVGTATAAVNRQASSPNFTLNIEAAPFEVRMDPPTLLLPQGAPTPWKVNVVRRGYEGTIKVELRNLPKEVTANFITLFRGQNTGKLDLTAEEESPGGDHMGVQLVATAVNLDNKQVIVSNLGLRIQEPFSLGVEPAILQLVEGAKSIIKVKVTRRTYLGPIDLSLKNLPPQVTANKVSVSESMESAEIELVAAPNAPGNIRNNVQVVGLTNTNRKVVSPPFTVGLQSKLFDLKVRPEFLTLPQGDKALLKIMATRRNYQGPIALEFRNLPAEVTGPKVTLPAGQNEMDLEVAAAQDATPSSKTDVHVLGTATMGGNQQVASAPFRVDVKTGLYELKVEPAILKVSHGATAKLKVIVIRRGYKGNINLELKNLPKEVRGSPGMIPPDKNDTEIDVKAEFAAVESDTVDTQVRGSGSLNEKQVYSPRFTISVVSFGQDPVLEVKPAVTSLKIAPGSTAKLKVNLVRKKHDGPVTVELRNLPMGLESSKEMVDQGKNTAEITVTARPNAELGIRPDVCILATATLGTGPHTFASPAITLQVQKK
jgi:hypothetical protein